MWTLQGLSVGSQAIEPFDPETFSGYEASMTTNSANQGASVKGVVRTGQIYACSFGDGYDSSIGASWLRSTNMGQKSYKLNGGTGGTAIASADLPEGYDAGTTADIPVKVTASIGGTVVSTYEITVHRTYLHPAEN